jgi:cytidylate kinase
MIITIDGTAASGKSTTAMEVARRLGFKYIDTGAMYRALALDLMRKRINPREVNQVEEISRDIKIDFVFRDGENHTFLLNEDVTEKIRDERVGELASLVATYKGVRKNLVSRQREMGKDANVVCEGRDIGTVVFKDAEIKIYMNASINVRATRREKELKERGVERDISIIRDSLRKRDLQDKKRGESPLRVPQNAYIVDTTNLTIEEEIEKVMSIVKAGVRYRSDTL